MPHEAEYALHQLLLIAMNHLKNTMNKQPPLLSQVMILQRQALLLTYWQLSEVYLLVLQVAQLRTDYQLNDEVDTKLLKANSLVATGVLLTVILPEDGSQQISVCLRFFVDITTGGKKAITYCTR